MKGSNSAAAWKTTGTLLSSPCPAARVDGRQEVAGIHMFAQPGRDREPGARAGAGDAGSLTNAPGQTLSDERAERRLTCPAGSCAAVPCGRARASGKNSSVENLPRAIAPGSFVFCQQLIQGRFAYIFVLSHGVGKITNRYWAGWLTQEIRVSRLGSLTSHRFVGILLETGPFQHQWGAAPISFAGDRLPAVLDRRRFPFPFLKTPSRGVHGNPCEVSLICALRV